MSTDQVILFTFAGRQANMEVQLPMVARILHDNLNTEFHVWNLSLNRSDDRFIRQLGGYMFDRFGIPDERVVICNQFYDRRIGWRKMNLVYRFYAHNRFRDHLFAKIDDDVIFIESQRFSQFIDAVDNHRGTVISANVINNGACTPVNPRLREAFTALDIPLLDVHLSGEYAREMHEAFFDHHGEMLGQPVSLIPTDDWLSINLIGYDWNTAHEIARRVGGPSPEHIAGREFVRTSRLGDEGMVNTLPRVIMRGFTAGHLSFGPQVGRMTEQHWDGIRSQYQEIATKYLAGLP